jgi:protein SCO1/2
MPPDGPGAGAPHGDLALTQQTRARVAVIAVVAVVVLVAGLAVAATRGSSPPVYLELAGDVALPSVVLTDTEGRPFDLRTDTSGRVTLLFFGYLSCPDACPIQMAVLGKAFEGLEGPVREQVEVVFVTTDPRRDTPADLREYLDRFDPSFIGLTGSPDALRDLQFAAGVPAAVAEPADADGDYLVGHASQVLVFDREGVARRAYPLGVRQTDWAADIPRLVEADPR